MKMRTIVVIALKHNDYITQSEILLNLIKIQDLTRKLLKETSQNFLEYELISGKNFCFFSSILVFFSTGLVSNKASYKLLFKSLL